MATTIQIHKTLYKVSDFISWQRAGNLTLAPEFQRRSVWKRGAKSFFIDTIVRGLPIPIIFLRDRRTSLDQFEPVREVVDGQQRLRTVLGYISANLLSDYDPHRDEFTVKRTHNKELAGKAFNDLAPESKQAILDYEFVVHVLPSRIDDREIIQIFRRMNSTNYTLTTQEQRNAQYYGEFKTSVYSLAAEQLMRWRKWKTFTEDDIARMTEVEHTAECVMMIIDGQLSGKSAPRINKAFKDYDEVFNEREEAERRFRAIMDSLDDNFGSQLPDFVFFKKTLIYTFFSFLYERQFGFQEPLSKSLEAKRLSTGEIAQVKLANERIRGRVAPKAVLEATDRRTTNPMERQRLLDYLLSTVKKDA